MEQDVFQRSYEKQFRYVWNLCIAFLRNVEDTEDAVQEVFLRLLDSDSPFADEGQIRAWLIVTAKNVCRDELRRARRRDVPLDDAQSCAVPAPEIDETLALVRSLPLRYRIPIYLFYYEGYSTAQIAALLNRKESTVRSDLRRGRKKLKDILEESS